MKSIVLHVTDLNSNVNGDFDVEFEDGNKNLSDNL